MPAAAEPAAGLSALAAYNNLAPPRRPVIAVGSKKWSLISEDMRKLTPDDEDVASVEVEIWSYPPQILAKGPAVDRLSPSMEGSGDERGDCALDELMEGMGW